MDKYRLLYNSDRNIWEIEERKSFLWVFKWWKRRAWFSFGELTEALKLLALLNKKPPMGVQVKIN